MLALCHAVVTPPFPAAARSVVLSGGNADTLQTERHSLTWGFHTGEEGQLVAPGFRTVSQVAVQWVPSMPTKHAGMWSEVHTIGHPDVMLLAVYFSTFTVIAPL